MTYLFLEDESLCHNQDLFHNRDYGCFTFPTDWQRPFYFPVDNYSPNVYVFLQQRDVDRFIMFVNASAHSNAARGNSSRADVQFLGKYRKNRLICGRSDFG